MGLGTKRTAALMSGAALVLVLGAAMARAQDAAASGEAAENQKKEEAQSSSTVKLDRITVVSRTGETAIGTMASVSHVDQEQLERRMATTTADQLFGVPGVTVQTDSKRLASSVNIRGLQDYGRVAVIVDGARQDFQRSGHGTQSTFWLDPELVQEVDVLRGPVANTYGSGAIGGVVFFETKDPEDFLRPGETYAVATTGRYESNGNGWTTSATGAYRFSDVASVIGNIVWRDYGDYTDGSGNKVVGTGFDVLSGMLKTTLRPTDTSELKLGWVGANDTWEESSGVYDMGLKQNTFTGRYHVADPDRTWLDLHINASYSKSNLTQDYLTSVTQFDPTSGSVVTIPAGSRTAYDIGTYSIDLWNTSRLETGRVSHELTYGGDWLKDEVDTSSPIGGSDFYTPSGKRTVWGAYVQEKLTYDWLEVVGALRYDSYSLDGTSTSTSGDRLSPRITVGISPFSQASLEGLQFYGTYAEGYRSPSISETLISGLHPSGVMFPFLPNANLKPETAKTIEFGVNYRRDGIVYANDSLRLKAAYFNNDVSDFIDGVTLSAYDPTSGCPLRTDLLGTSGYIPICYQYQNYSKARIHGFEFEAFYDTGHYFGGLSASIIDGYKVSDGAREALSTIPSTQVTGQVGFRMLEKALTFGGEVQYNRPPDGSAFKKDYTLVNAFVSYRVNDNFKLDFRADNLLDVRYANPLNASTTSIIYEPGLTLKFAATARFGG